MFAAMTSAFTPAMPTELKMVYVITPSYTPYEDACDAAVFISNDKKKAEDLLQLLNTQGNNDVVKYIHNWDSKPVNNKFRLRKFTPNFFKVKTTVSNIHYDFLLVEGLINQTLDKHASSQRNEKHFNSQHLNSLRTLSADKLIV
jgi:hypothetical protein